MKDICESPYYQDDHEAHVFELNDKYKEILRLQKMLADNNIPHVIRRNFDGWQVCYPVCRPSYKCVMDAIQTSGSYGREQDLLEIMGLLTPEEEEYDDVAGYLTAENVFERIKKHWEENREK